jgi:ABC-type glycerol-3-phosphate transport system substrate-binding protein
MSSKVIRLVRASGALLVLFVCLACFSDAQAAEGWQQEWERTVQAAKKEGQVTVYVHSTYAPVLATGAFEKAFPGIKLTVVSGIENDLERCFSAERRAGKYLADVFMVGVLRSNDFKQAKYLDPIKPVLLLPEVVDEFKWWRVRTPISRKATSIPRAAGLTVSNMSIPSRGRR